MAEGCSDDIRAEVGDDRAIVHGPGLALEFRRLDDRWTHAILDQNSGIALVASMPLPAATEEPGRIADPVYQEVQLHGAAGGSAVCLLLTGLSFNHHFSAAVTMDCDPLRPGTVAIEFDVADRCRSSVESLAATYLVGLDSGALVAADSERIVWDVAGPAPRRLELVAGPGAVLALAEAGRKATRIQILARIERGAFTHRLRYGWRWASTDGLTR